MNKYIKIFNDYPFLDTGKCPSISSTSSLIIGSSGFNGSISMGRDPGTFRAPFPSPLLLFPLPSEKGNK